MKHIKTINEFFGLFKKNSDEDKIALEFIKRLEKVDKLISSNQGENPYTVEKLSKSYKVIFDDVDIKVTNKSFRNRLGGLIDYYSLSIDDKIGNIEKIECKEKYKKKLYDLASFIYSTDKSKKRFEKVWTNINPAADRL